MKVPSNSILVIAILTSAIGLVGCGKKGMSSSSASSGSGSSLRTPSPTIPNPPIPETNGQILSYEFVKLGNETFTTPAISTDNVLKVTFTIGSIQDNAQLPNFNATNQATDLAVVIAVNGREVVPTYTSQNYIYGEVNEVSAIIDFSQNLTPGVPVVVTVKAPKNNFYCTYLASTNGYLNGVMTNPLANAYPGCRKPVAAAHRWSGNLKIQTSHTAAL
jgi:hypothetical protein